MKFLFLCAIAAVSNAAFTAVGTCATTSVSTDATYAADNTACTATTVDTKAKCDALTAGNKCAFTATADTTSGTCGLMWPNICVTTETDTTATAVASACNQIVSAATCVSKDLNVAADVTACGAEAKTTAACGANAKCTFTEAVVAATAKQTACAAIRTDGTKDAAELQTCAADTTNGCVWTVAMTKAEVAAAAKVVCDAAAADETNCTAGYDAGSKCSWAARDKDNSGTFVAETAVCEAVNVATGTSTGLVACYAKAGCAFTGSGGSMMVIIIVVIVAVVVAFAVLAYFMGWFCFGKGDNANV